MAKAWIVTKGQYSSQENVAVFTSEEAALAFCKPQWDYLDRAQAVRRGLPHDRYEIEEVELNPVNVPEDTRLIFSVSFDAKGDVTYLTILDPDEQDREPVRGWRNGKVEVALHADDKEQAIKAAAEIRAQWLVEHQDDELPTGINFGLTGAWVEALREIDYPSLEMIRNRQSESDAPAPTKITWGFHETPDR